MTMFLDRLSIKFKVQLIASIGVIAFLSALTQNLSFYRSTNSELDFIKDKELPILRVASHLLVQLREIDRAYLLAIADGDEERYMAANKIADSIKRNIHSIGSLNPKMVSQAEELTLHFTDYHKKISSYAEFNLSDDMVEDLDLDAFSEVQVSKTKYEQAVKNVTIKVSQDFKNTIDDIQQLGNKTIFQQTAGAAILLSIMTLISYYIIRTISAAIASAITVARAVAKEDWNTQIDTSGEHEISMLLVALKKMRDRLKEQSDDNNQRDLLRKRIANLNEAVHGGQKIELLFANIIQCMARELNIALGSLWQFTGDELKLGATFAYQIESARCDRLKLGETLIGQCALEQRVLKFDNLPEDFTSIISTTGSSRPSYLYLYPLVHDGKLKGVMEFGMFSKLTGADEEFLEQSQAIVAISINTAQSNIKLAGMLQDSLAQKQVLESQKEELRSTNEELEEQTNELKLSESNLQTQGEELRVLNEELEERARLLDKQKSEILDKNEDLERSKSAIIEKSEQLELSSQYKSDFLSTMSHELRTPLNSILILSQHLLDNKANNLHSTQIEHAKVINSSGSDLLLLINDILDLSKVEEGKLELDYQTIELKDFLSVIYRQFEFQAQESNLEFAVTITDDVPHHISVDDHRLSQILRNLLSNALKFTEHGSVNLTVTRPAGQLKPKRKHLAKDAICFTVVDSGIGIPLEKQSRVFEAFSQLDAKTSRKYGGTGLGLTISRELASIMGGEIQVFSAGENQGASFSLLLPESNIDHETKKLLTQVESQEQDELIDKAKKNLEALSREPIADLSAAEIQPPPGGATPVHHHRTILIIEDDPEFSESLSKLAQEFGLNYQCVNTCSEAKHYVKDNIPGAIILDSDMPDLIDSNLIEFFKTEGEISEIPLHVISRKENIGGSEATNKSTKPIDKGAISQLFDDIVGELTEEPKHLLIIEDDPVIQKVLVELFEEIGIDLLIASSYEETKPILASRNLDCIVVDLKLSDADGLDIIRDIRQNPSYLDIPILVYTAMDVSLDLESEILRYADRIILKEGNSLNRLLEETSLFLHWVDRKHESTEKSDPIDDEDIGDFAGKIILMVDDDMRNLYSLSAALEEFGFEIITAVNGKEAIEELEKCNDVSLILMDIMMPEMDGYEATRRIRDIENYQNVPIIALTAKAMKEDKVKCLEAGANDYLTKPIDLKKLKAIIKVWLKNKAG